MGHKTENSMNFLPSVWKEQEMFHSRIPQKLLGTFIFLGRMFLYVRVCVLLYVILVFFD